MTVLFGHPAGNPNSHHAALAYYESGLLEAFCVPWMPPEWLVRTFSLIPSLRPAMQRLSRRRFAPLAGAPLVHGRLGEIRRLSLRALALGDERLSYEANDWLMETMRRECARPAVSVVHAYEDCALWQFERAHGMGKACVYELPIAFYTAWEATRGALLRRYSEWLPAVGLPSSRYVRPEQKRKEMALADLVLAPSSYVAETVRREHPGKRIEMVPYGVDSSFWTPADEPRRPETLCFVYAGQVSLRKGIPLLIEAWRQARLQDARLEIVGRWELASEVPGGLPAGMRICPPVSAAELRARYRAADVFVFPSNFEGFGLVLLEAMACGLPVIATRATAAPDVLTPASGRIIDADDLDQLVASLRWFADNRQDIPAMGRAARHRAQECSWQKYRSLLVESVRPLV